MAWSFSHSLVSTARSLEDLAATLSRELTRLAQVVRCYEQVAVLTYGTTVRPGGDLSRQQLVTVTNATAFTVANPRSPREGVEIVLDIHNSSGGAMGAITWGSEYQLAGAMTNPANGKHRLIAFYRTRDSKWRELYRSAADI